MNKKAKNISKPATIEKERKGYSAEELLKLGKEKNEMDFAKTKTDSTENRS